MRPLSINLILIGQVGVEHLREQLPTASVLAERVGPQRTDRRDDSAGVAAGPAGRAGRR